MNTKLRMMRGWINRKDQEPDPKMPYILVWDDHDQPDVAHFDDGDWYYFNDYRVYFSFWMPIAQSPFETTLNPPEESKGSQETLTQLKHLESLMEYVLIDHENRLRKLEKDNDETDFSFGGSPQDLLDEIHRIAGVDNELD